MQMLETPLKLIGHNHRNECLSNNCFNISAINFYKPLKYTRLYFCNLSTDVTVLRFDLSRLNSGGVYYVHVPDLHYTGSDIRAGGRICDQRFVNTDGRYVEAVIQKAFQ